MVGPGILIRAARVRQLRRDQAQPRLTPRPSAPPPAPPLVPTPLPATTRRRQLVATGGYPIDVDVEVPEHIARWRPLVQWILAIPLLIVVYVLGIVAEVCAIIGWFAALFTGRLPEGLGNIIAGYYRYYWRSYSYAWFLRDKYPPFGLAASYGDPDDDPAWFEVRPGQGLSRLPVRSPDHSHHSPGHRVVLSRHRAVLRRVGGVLCRALYRALASRLAGLRGGCPPLDLASERLVPTCSLIRIHRSRSLIRPGASAG